MQSGRLTFMLVEDTELDAEKVERIFFLTIWRFLLNYYLFQYCAILFDALSNE